MMRLRFKLIPALILAGFLYAPATSGQQDPVEKQTKQQKKEEQERDTRKADRGKELGYDYRATLNEMLYILLDEEIAAFKRLSTNEERENFIEIIWNNLDPTPGTVENEFRDEHYRRIAYANERFASGIPGWKTDRGRIYIIWGPPDEIESRPAGGPYDRPSWEGGGRTTVHAFEQWRYRHMEGIGDNVILEFVDRSGSGEYRLTSDPGDKDAMTFVPGAGPTESEMRGVATRAQRFTNPYGTLGPSAGGMPAWMNPFDRLAQFARVQVPPARYKELQLEVSTRVLRDQMKFAYRFDFLRITDESVLVPITLQIPNREMHFESRDGIYAATISVVGRVTTPGGRVVQAFEETLRRDFPESTFRAELGGQSVYQKALPLRPGLYKLELLIKDMGSGDLGAVSTKLAVPRFAPEQLASSTLILADRIEPVPAGRLGGQFVLGASKVRPRVDFAFTDDDHLGLFLQVYNLAVDPASRKPSASVRYRITRGQRELFNQSETGEALGARGSQLTVEKLLPLREFEPGEYALEVVVTDHVAGQALTQRATFTVKVPEQRAAR